MSPETDEQLIKRVLDPELIRDDKFITNEEVLAYARHLSDRDLVDTEANRATWIAARTYYDREASGADETTAGPNWEAMVASHEAILSTHNQRISDLQFRLNEDRVKEMSLSMAVQASVGENAQTVVSKAKAFEAFLTGSES